MAQLGKLTTADYLEMDQFVKLINGLHADEEYLWELYCRLSFYTALRSSDVLNIQWKDILNKDVLTRIEKKTGKQRQIKFGESPKERITELYRHLGSPPVDEHIFQSPRRTCYTIQRVNQLLKEFRYRYKIKIDAFSTHTFRKTFGRYVYEMNDKSAESLILLNSIFNHSSIEITKVYIGIRQDEIDNIYSSINI